MEAPNSTELMNNINTELAAEGLQVQEISNKLDEQIIPALATAKNIQAALYAYEPPYAKGTVRKAKNTVLTKVRNVVVNVLEKVVMRQQKYNELLFQAVTELHAENEELKTQLAKLTDHE